MATVAPDWFLRSRLKMRHIHLVVAVDELRSIHKAAAALRMTQPAATKLLSDLERVLAIRLFERTTRGIIPTPQGASLARHARTILGTLDHARDELAAISTGSTGKLTIGVLLVVAPVLLPRALLAFKRRNAQVTVQVREGTLGTLLPLLHAGELDLVVGRLTSDFATAGLSFTPCYDEPMTLVVRRGHPLTRRRTPSLAGLVGESWILPTPEAAYRQRIDAAFRQAGVEPPAQRIESMSILTNTTLLQEARSRCCACRCRSRRVRSESSRARIRRRCRCGMIWSRRCARWGGRWGGGEAFADARIHLRFAMRVDSDVSIRRARESGTLVALQFNALTTLGPRLRGDDDGNGGAIAILR